MALANMLINGKNKAKNMSCRSDPAIAGEADSISMMLMTRFYRPAFAGLQNDNVTTKKTPLSLEAFFI
jgi:hypothetical protein